MNQLALEKFKSYMRIKLTSYQKPYMIQRYINVHLKIAELGFDS